MLENFQCSRTKRQEYQYSNPVPHLLKVGLAALVVIFLGTACDSETDIGLQAQHPFSQSVSQSKQWGLPVMEYYYNADPERLEITVPVGEDYVRACFEDADITLTVFDKDRRPSIQNPETNEWTYLYTKTWNEQFFRERTNNPRWWANAEANWDDLQLTLTVDGSVANNSPGMWLTKLSGVCEEVDEY